MATFLVNKYYYKYNNNILKITKCKDCQINNVACNYDNVSKGQTNIMVI